MPVRASSNNRILPANSRAADVAEKAIREIIPTQQARYYNAFRPQGIKCVLYNRMTAGRKCTCQSSEKQLAGRLDEQGKADVGTINELLTGKVFNIETYGVAQYKANPETQGMTSPFAPTNFNQGVFDIHTAKPEPVPQSRTIDGPSFGDNGPVNPGFDLDALVRDFDAGAAPYMMDAHCPVCFGTGFVGGYVAFQSHRHVLTCADVKLQDGELDVGARPWTATARAFTATLTLPRGALSVDAFRVMNGKQQVGGVMKLDGKPVNNYLDVLAVCDGLPHTLNVTFPTRQKFTHFELQFCNTTESSYFEFPRLTSSSDTAVLDNTEPFQIIMSPNIPSVQPEDVISESMFGRTLIVMNVNNWNSRQRNILGWECQVRVLQPPEIQRLMPHRGRVMTKDRTTLQTRDNVTGHRRT